MTKDKGSREYSIQYNTILLTVLITVLIEPQGTESSIKLSQYVFRNFTLLRNRENHVPTYLPDLYISYSYIISI